MVSKLTIVGYRGGQLSLQHVEQSHGTHDLVGHRQQLGGRLAVYGVIQVERPAVWRAVFLQHAV